MEKRIVKNILIQKTPHYAFPMLCGALYLFFNLFLYSTLKFSPSGTIKFAGTVTIGKRESGCLLDLFKDIYCQSSVNVIP